jgi:uncharacterized repeat protein (TIGR01451 family)
MEVKKFEMKSDKKMAILISLVLLASACALVLPASGADKYLWQQVSEEGFGDLTNDYAWSMASYTANGTEYLYVGTLNSNLSSGVFNPDNWSNVTDGCEIWRTNGSMNGSNYDWEQVVGPVGTQDIIIPAIPFPITVNTTAGFGEFNYGARKMLVYQDLLWVGTMRPACEVWVTNGTHWKLANVPGFSAVPGLAISSTSVRSMAIFNDTLYVGVDNAQNGAMVFKYNGSTNFNDIGNLANIGRWEQVNVPGFGEPEVNLGIGELITFSASENYLYAGTWNFTAQELVQMLLDLNFSMMDGCQVWRTNGTVNGSGPELIWEKVADSGFDSSLNGAVMSSAVFDGGLYMGTMNFGTGAEIWRTANGTDWECVADLGFFNFTLTPPPPTVDFRGFGNGYMWNMIVFDNKLFVGTLNPILGCQVWASTTGDPNSFEQVNINGMNEERAIPVDIGSLFFMGIDQYGVRTFAEFNGSLHLGTASFGDWIDKAIALEAENFSTNFSEYVGCEIWRTDGSTYTPPTVEVDKTVWDPASEAWIDADLEPFFANVTDTVRFNVTIHANGTYNLTDFVVIDFLSSSLEYTDNATLCYPNGTVVNGDPDINMSDSWECDTYFTSVTILLWDLSDIVLEPCQSLALEYNATVVRCGVETEERDINFVGALGLSTESPEYGYSWDYALVYAPCPDGDATDPTGLVKDVYLPGETVYATGSSFVPNSLVDIYVTEDKHWVNGMPINSTIYAVKYNVSTDGAGSIIGEEIWPNSEPGAYDMIFDANQNGNYDIGVDAVDNPNDSGFTVLPKLPALTPFGLAVLVGLLSIIATSTLSKKRKKRA